MWAKLKAYIAPTLVVLALLLIGVVGHRHWIAPTHTPPVIEEPVVEQPKPTKPKPKKPAPKEKAEPSPKQPKKTPVVPVPVPGPRRECDVNGWCWTYF